MNIKTKPKSPYQNWTIESHTPVGKIDLEKVVFHLEPEQQNGYIKGEVLRERLKDKRCLDGAVLDYLLKHPKKIPESWKKDGNGNTRYIFFWGTDYRGSDGDLHVRYLCWFGGRWDWGFNWLGRDWDGGNPAALRASTQSLKPQNSLDTLPLELIINGVKYKQI